MLTRDLHPAPCQYDVVWDGHIQRETVTPPSLPDYSGLPDDPRGRPRLSTGRPRSRIVHQRDLARILSDGQARTKHQLAMALDWSGGRLQNVLLVLIQEGRVEKVPGPPPPAHARYRIVP